MSPDHNGRTILNDNVNLLYLNIYKLYCHHNGKSKTGTLPTSIFNEQGRDQLELGRLEFRRLDQHLQGKKEVKQVMRLCHEYHNIPTFQNTVHRPAGHRSNPLHPCNGAPSPNFFGQHRLAWLTTKEYGSSNLSPEG